MESKVYLVQNSEGHYKIGRTTKTIDTRIKQLQTGSSLEIFPIAECTVLYASKVEAKLHRNYSRFQLLNEWFDLPEDIVEGFIDEALRADRMFKMLSDSGNPFV